MERERAYKMKIVEKHQNKKDKYRKPIEPIKKEEPYRKRSYTTKTIKGEPHEGEIWTAYWNCGEDEATTTCNKKSRPIYIDKIQGYTVIGYEITKHLPRKMIGEYVIPDWQSWGLRVPSTLRCTQVDVIPFKQLGNKIGEVTPQERMKIDRFIENTYKKNMPNALDKFNKKYNTEEPLEEGNRFKRMNRTLFGDRDDKIKTFAIISPENPLGWKDTDEQEFKGKYLAWTKDKSKYNKAQIINAKEEFLAKQIERTGDDTLKYGAFSYVPIKGSYGDKEKSFFIFNIPFADAKEIARNYGQESFFFGMVKNGEMQVAYYETNDACKTYHRVEISNTITNEKEAQDFFSKYGVKYRINLKYFGDDVVPLDNEWGFEEDLKEPSTFKSRARARRKVKESIDKALKK